MADGYPPDWVVKRGLVPRAVGKEAKSGKGNSQRRGAGLGGSADLADLAGFGPDLGRCQEPNPAISGSGPDLAGFGRIWPKGMLHRPQNQGGMLHGYDNCLT